MRVDWAIVCRYIEVNNNLATMVGVGIDTYYVPEFPAQVHAVVGIRLVGTPPTGPFSLSAVMLDPQFAEVSNLSADITLEPNPANQPGWESQVIIPTTHVFVAETEGAYTLSITVDGSPAHTIPILVRPANPAVA